MENLKNNWGALLSLPKDRLIAQFGLLVFATYLIKSGVENPWLSLPLILGLLFYMMLKQPAYLSSPFWMGAAAVLLTDIILNYFNWANHHFVLFYFCLVLAITFSCPGPEREKILTVNSRWLIAGIMFFAAFQKVLSPAYASGSFMGSMALSGELVQLLTPFFPGVKAALSQNRELLIRIATEKPTLTETYKFIAPFPFFRQVSIFFAYVIALSELLVALAFVFFDSQKWRHILLIGIILGVFIVRLETGFLSILCLLGMAHCPSQWTKYRGIYIGLILLFVSLIIIGLGIE